MMDSGEMKLLQGHVSKNFIMSQLGYLCNQALLIMIWAIFECRRSYEGGADKVYFHISLAIVYFEMHFGVSDLSRVTLLLRGDAFERFQRAVLPHRQVRRPGASERSENE